MESSRKADRADGALISVSPDAVESHLSGTEPPAPGARPRSDRRRAHRGVGRSDLVLVGLLIALVTVVYTVYALRVGNFQNDEEQYMVLARYIAQHFPSALWQSGIYPRGTQRLDSIVLALPFALLRGPGAYQVGHAIQCLLFASAALPVFLLTRRTGLGRIASLFAATLSVVVPWAVVATSFLAESAAYPVYAWVLYATWLAAHEPSPRNDAFALGTLILAGLSRTAMLALAPILPLAIVWHEWSWNLAGTPRTRRARALAARLWSRHAFLTVIVAMGLLALVADRAGLLPGRGLAALTGAYGLPNPGPLSSLLDRYRDYLARLTVGTGFFAVALALPWTVLALIRPRDGARHTTAIICALGTAVILLSLLQAGPDERYILYGAAPIAIGTAAALSDWASAPRPSWRAALVPVIAALVVVVLIDSVTWPGLTNAYDFFTYPAAIFYQRVLLGHADLLRFAPLHLAPDRTVEAAIIVCALLFAIFGRRRRAVRPAATLIAVGLLVLCATQTLYALRKFTATAGGATGPGAEARSWVDEHVPSGVRVGALAVSMGETASYLPIWRATEFWNTSVKLDVYLQAPGALPFPLGSEAVQLAIQAPSGRLTRTVARGATSYAPAPRYLLVPQQGTNRIGLQARVLATDPYLPLELVELDTPARVDWSIAGTSDEGFMASGRPATATIYEGALAGGRQRCATFSLIAPPNFTNRWPYTVAIAGHEVRRGSLVALQTVGISVPLPSRRAGGVEELKVRVHGEAPLGNGVLLGAKLAFFAVSRCPAATP